MKTHCLLLIVFLYLSQTSLEAKAVETSDLNDKSFLKLCMKQDNQLSDNDKVFLKMLFFKEKRSKKKCHELQDEFEKSKKLELDPSDIQDIKNLSFLHHVQGIEELTLHACGNKFCNYTGQFLVESWEPVNQLKLKRLTLSSLEYFKNEEELWSFFRTTQIPEIRLTAYVTMTDCEFKGNALLAIRHNQQNRKFYCNDKLLQPELFQFEELIVHELPESTFKNIDLEELNIDIYKNACALNKGESCFFLGFIYKNYLQDEALAKSYYKKSCELKYWKGCYNIAGIMLASSLYDRGFASDYFKKACDLARDEKCLHLEKLKKVQSENSKINYYTLIDQVFPETKKSSLKSASIYAEKSMPFKVIDPLKWKIYMANSCRLSQTTSCLLLAKEGLSPNGFRSSYINYYEVACEMNDGEGCYQAGIKNIDGTAFRKYALEYFEEGCQLNHPSACEVASKLKEIMAKNPNMSAVELRKILLGEST